jgi:large subunit ribosomal protein L10
VDRAAKRELVSTLNDVFANTSVVVVAHYKGLTVADMQKLRTQMKQAGATVKVAKNRLAKIALEGTDVASIQTLMKGPTLIAYSSDPVAAPKVAVDFAKGNDKLVILGGAMGTTALNPDSVKALATMLPRRRSRRSSTRRRRSSPACSGLMPRQAKRRNADPPQTLIIEPNTLKDQNHG